MEFNQLVRIIFQSKDNYEHINPEEKEKLFFIFNRTITRGNPLIADALNRKGIDKSLATDVWFNYAKNTTRPPDWFTPNWSKLKKDKENSLLKKYDSIDRKILSFYPEALEEERKRIEKEKEESIIVIKNKKNKKK
jgi:hypothetical protein